MHVIFNNPAVPRTLVSRRLQFACGIASAVMSIKGHLQRGTLL